jgi:two-component system chemotaxis sensor kinase CheA
MSDLDDFKATYFDECSELLTELEEQFAAIEAGERDADRLNAVFRAIHSIKGGAGAFGFSALVGFAHAYETLLDYVRDGRVEMSDDVVALCIRANDIVADHVKAAQTGEALPADYGMDEKERFDALARGDAAGGDDEDGEPLEEFDIEFTPVMVNLDAPVAAGAEDEPLIDDAFEAAPMQIEPGHWEVRFTPHRALYARANDPLLLFRELAALGEMHVRAVLEEIPPLSDFEPFAVYCSWEITMISPDLTEAMIREVFEFVEGDCDIAVAQLGSDAAAFEVPPAPVAPKPAPAASAEPDPADLLALADDEVASLLDFAGDADVAVEPQFTPEPEPAPVSAQDSFEEPPTLSFAELAETIQPGPAAKPAAPAAAAVTPLRSAPPAGSSEGEESGGNRSVGVQSIRVDLDKVDRVVNMVGELVITQSMLTQQMDETLRARYTELVRGLEVLAQTTRGLQDSVMAIRAQPVKSVFSRMPRLVRELATKTGKKIKLETIGENTEIDKTVIEQLSDPLTHMIRNSADHGIESPDKRLERGKSETGTIRLSAEQAGGNILIIVEDDGGGINREKVLQLARDKGIVAADMQPTDEQIDQLIFAPGFSTASEVSDISGRGVGMDVVLSNIKKIGGSVHVRSWTGKGCRMTLRLPLTLAVLDVMLVKVGVSPYVVPLSSIVETIQCSRASFERVPSGGQVLQVRGEYVQVIDLAKRFEMVTETDPENRFVVLCEAEGSAKVALIVDDIIGQQQVVIKSLEENFERVDGIAGGTILGDGNVALIVDVQGLKTTIVHKNAA